MDYMVYSSENDVAERINDNKDFIRELKQKTIEVKDFEKKCVLLDLIGQISSSIITGEYVDPEAEKMIIDLSYQVEDDFEEKSDDADCLIVMSSVGAIGGHTVIANNWMHWDAHLKYSVVLTNQAVNPIPDFLTDTISRYGGKLYNLKGSYFRRAQGLRALSRNYKRILLITHMNDIIPLLAYGKKNWEIPVYFYNHADFRFSYGYSISDVILNIFESDKEKTKKSRGVQSGNYVLPFPNNGIICKENGIANAQKKKELEKEELFNKYNLNVHRKLIVSAGQDFKYADILGYSFTDFVKKLLIKCDDADFIIIGPDDSSVKWKELKEATNGRAKAIGFIDRSEMEQIIAAADLYVISFPKGAHGASMAITHRVPFITLALLPKSDEVYKRENTAHSIDELIDKAIDALTGESHKYINTRNGFIDYQKWNEIWQSIYSTHTEHSIRELEPNYEITKMEIINCQMLQTGKKTDAIHSVLNTYKLSFDLLRILSELEEKYHIGLFPDSFYIGEVNAWTYYSKNQKNYDMYKKCDRLYSYMSRWMICEKQGKHVVNYLKQRSISELFVYGYGNMGRVFCEVLGGSTVHIKGIIDHNYKKIPEEFTGIRPQDYSDCGQVIINTSVDDNDLIDTALGGRNEIISLFDIIDSLCS